jgi:ABC-type glutathione transport system ATPase component
MSDTIRYVENPLSVDRPGIGVNLIYMASEGVVFFALTLLLEYGFFFSKLRGIMLRRAQGSSPQKRVVKPLLLHGEDEDVAAERKKVMSGSTTEEETVIIENLVKEYRRSLDGCTLRAAKLAINGISLTVPHTECFGLLGVNGAGKTTTFSILTGDMDPTSGTAVIAGYDIRTDLRKVYSYNTHSHLS